MHKSWSYRQWDEGKPLIAQCVLQLQTPHNRGWRTPSPSILPLSQNRGCLRNCQQYRCTVPAMSFLPVAIVGEKDMVKGMADLTWWILIVTSQKDGSSMRGIHKRGDKRNATNANPLYRNILEVKYTQGTVLIEWTVLPIEIRPQTCRTGQASTDRGKDCANLYLAGF